MNRANVSMERLRRERNQLSAQDPDWSLREQELWEQLLQRQAELDAVLSSLRCARQVCQLRAETAQSLVSGTFWFKDFGVLQPRGVRNPLKVIAMTQQKILPRLERLIQLLEESKALGQSTSTQRQQSSSKQAFGRDSDSRAWTESASVVKGVSTQSFKDQIKASSVSEQNATVPSLPLSNPSYAQKSQEKTQLNSQDVRSLLEPGASAHTSIPKLAEEDWSRLVALSPLFQLMKEVEQQLRDCARDRGLMKIQPSGSSRPFMDFMDAQWECEGKLIQVSFETLNPRELLLYQHGQFLLQHLHLHKMIPTVTLQLASSLPTNDYHNNAFRNSFYYQEDSERTLFVRSQRLQSVGGLSLLLMHCAAHISTGQMKTDCTPAFQRAFFKVLQVGLSELFHSRLGQADSPEHNRMKDLASDGALDGLLLERVQKPSPGIFSEDEVLGRLSKYREASVYRRVESLLKEPPKSLEIHLNTDPSLNHGTDSQDAAPQ